MIRAIAITLMLSMLAVANTACIGRMALGKKVMEFNLSATESQWGREGLFFLMYVIPVYPTCGAIDLLIINSIEFWSGKNPISGEERLAFAGDQKFAIAEDGSQGVTTLREDGSIDVEVRTAEGDAHFVNLVREEDRIVARDAEGHRIASVDRATGTLHTTAGNEGL
jgi:hypothetical protein